MKNKENKKGFTPNRKVIKDVRGQLDFKYEDESDDKSTFKRRLLTNKRRNSKNIFTFLIMCSLALLSSCNYTGKKVSHSDLEHTGKSANMNNDEFMADVEKFKAETHETLSLNDKNISIINMELIKDSAGHLLKYKQRIDLCDQKNDELKSRINEYSVNSLENWLWFKSEFTKNIDELDLELKRLLRESSNKNNL
ncbi:hypothetical protein [Polluticaenibacter yanchengensis]|uniref:Uncharacterized protein n=1 Tax=Polluticaenibacter yanchengensis TaxID=3014562 RepID=A0ABT4UH25_9BACT|nr:hypothetical protein [Chitinophagaceae bacterium LY-5]